MRTLHGFVDNWKVYSADRENTAGRYFGLDYKIEQPRNRWLHELQNLKMVLQFPPFFGVNTPLLNKI